MYVFYEVVLCLYFTFIFKEEGQLGESVAVLRGRTEM